MKPSNMGRHRKHTISHRSSASTLKPSELTVALAEQSRRGETCLFAINTHTKSSNFDPCAALTVNPQKQSQKDTRARPMLERPWLLRSKSHRVRTLWKRSCLGWINKIQPSTQQSLLESKHLYGKDHNNAGTHSPQYTAEFCDKGLWGKGRRKNFYSKITFSTWDWRQ